MNQDLKDRIIDLRQNHSFTIPVIAQTTGVEKQLVCETLLEAGEFHGRYSLGNTSNNIGALSLYEMWTLWHDDGLTLQAIATRAGRSVERIRQRLLRIHYRSGLRDLYEERAAWGRRRPRPRKRIE